MAYRTKTYIAGDWDHDRDAVEQIYKWKNGNKWNLDFHDEAWQSSTSTK